MHQLHQTSQYYCHFIHIASLFDHMPNSCHRATDKKFNACTVAIKASAKSVAN